MRGRDLSWHVDTEVQRVRIIRIRVHLLEQKLNLFLRETLCFHRRVMAQWRNVKFSDLH
jgi:hypothetical protein